MFIFWRKWWNLNAEKQNLLKSMFCCEMFIFWRNWWNLNAEKQVMLRSTKSAENMCCCEMFIFWRNWWNLKCCEAGHAEKHKTCWKACFVVKWFLMEKIKSFNGCLIGEHSRNTQTGTKRYGRFIFVYMLIFFVLISTILLRSNYCAEKHWKTNLTRNAMSTIYPITECHQPQVCWTKTSRFVSTVDFIYMTWIHVGSNQRNIEIIL